MDWKTYQAMLKAALNPGSTYSANGQSYTTSDDGYLISQSVTGDIVSSSGVVKSNADPVTGGYSAQYQNGVDAAREVVETVHGQIIDEVIVTGLRIPVSLGAQVGYVFEIIEQAASGEYQADQLFAAATAGVASVAVGAVTAVTTKSQIATSPRLLLQDI